MAASNAFRVFCFQGGRFHILMLFGFAEGMEGCVQNRKQFPIRSTAVRSLTLNDKQKNK